MSPAQTVVVAMSGGVDSSVAAALLKQQGYRVIGLMMRLWSEPGAEEHNRCCTPDAMAQARRVAAMLGIPFYAVDAQDIFHDTVVTSFIQGYRQGDTPNPCLVCNRHIRWEFLLNRALSLGADAMATGHYVRLDRQPGQPVKLLKAVDAAKDQSYVLHVLNQQQLSHAFFPLGGFTKPQVRQLARDFSLPVAERAESQDLCFLGSQDYRSFLTRHAENIALPGPILTRSGQSLGQHQGLAFYTVGQRKGLGIAAANPLYVLDKDYTQNALIVGEAEELGSTRLETNLVNWQDGTIPEQPFMAQVKIRYKAREAPALVTPFPDGRASVQFDLPVRDATPGQAAVFYNGEVVLGGGTIRRVF